MQITAQIYPLQLEIGQQFIKFLYTSVISLNTLPATVSEFSSAARSLW